MYNFIEIYEDAYSKEFCDSIINSFEEANKLGRIFRSNKLDQSQDTRLIYDGAPNMNTVYFNGDIAQEFYSKLQHHYNSYCEKYSILKMSAPASPKGMQVQRTGPHEGYHSWHSETMNQISAVRHLTYLLYLNDIPHGEGDTEFLYQGVKVQPKAGTLLLWPPYFTHPHRGNPIYSGYKYILTGWISYDQ